MMTIDKLKSYIRQIPNWPKDGINFIDITTLLERPDAFAAAVDKMAEQYKNKHIDCVAAVEARGFILGSAIAYQLGAGFVPIRKPGKLPYKTVSEKYHLEYGTGQIEIHTDAIKPGQKVLVVDDLIATGGTIAAACKLIEQLGGKIAACAFLVELTFLPGREKLKGYEVTSLIKFDK